jgi:hypothetical protein
MYIFRMDPHALPKNAAEPGCAPEFEFYRAAGYAPEDSFGYLMRRILGTLGHEVEHQLAPTGRVLR